MKKTKHTTAWDIHDAIWQKWESIIENYPNESIDGLTWKDLANMVSPTDIEEWVKVSALQKFLFELKFCRHQPDTKSMRHLWGEHAMLYDVWGCYEHKFVITTHDDCDRFIDGQTVFCPYCNKDKFKFDSDMAFDGMDEYINFVGGKVETPEMWQETLKVAKIHRRIQNRMNRQYKFRKLFEKGYLKYKVKRFFKSLFQPA